MRKRTFGLIVLAALAGALVVLALRWPRLEPGMALIADERVGRNTYEIEYRMDRPFRVKVTHSISERVEPPEAHGFQVVLVPVRKSEQVGTAASRYDWLRGEHFARLRFSRAGGFLHIEGPGLSADIPIWCGKQAAEVRFLPHLEGTRLADGVGTPVLDINGDGKEAESVSFQAQSISDAAGP